MTATARSSRLHAGLACLVAWAVPGAAHLWMGRRLKGLVFLAAITLMFGIGILLEGRLFPFEFSQPLVALAALAELGAGALWGLARLAGLGAGRVAAVTYEYGNAFLIVAGLLNVLVTLDAYDIATGRR